MSWILSCALAVSLQQGAFFEDLARAQKKPCPTCLSSLPTEERQCGKNLMVFMSFSVPMETWKDLSDQLEMTDGIFIIRGIPGESFERLAEKIVLLRAAEVNAPIDIDPESFEKYGIESVPAFVLEDSKKSDRIVGNLRLDAALREIVEKGDACKSAKEILREIEGQR
jgi:type-F conjugative transfer system pilin assembly protein TrbC